MRIGIDARGLVPEMKDVVEEALVLRRMRLDGNQPLSVGTSTTYHASPDNQHKPVPSVFIFAPIVPA